MVKASSTKPSTRSQAEKLKDAAVEIESDKDGQKIDRALRSIKEKPCPKVCPECGHEFRGNGWDGIDVHWKARHEAVMAYEEAWPLLKAGTYM